MKKNKIIGLIFIIIGISIFLFKNILKDRNYLIETNKIEFSLSKETKYRYEKIEDTYDAVLSIPQIKLRKGIYTKNDTRNNISKNIMIHEKSDYPDKEKSNVILIAHSGTSNKSFFKNLYKLNLDSLVEFYYHHKKYVYKIANYYDVIKNGKVEIIRDENKKAITLITCSQFDETKQVIYIGYLVEEVEY